MAVKESDRRVYERFNARFPVKIKDTRHDFGTNIFLRDASAEGLRLTTREKVFINDTVSLEIKLPDGNSPMIINGQVVWVKTQDPDSLWDIGLKFHKVDLMKVQRLFKFTLPEPTE